MLMQIINLILINTQHVDHARRQVVDVLQRSITLHQYFFGAVVTCHNKVGSRCVENVINRLVEFRIAHFGLEQDRIER